MADPTSKYAAHFAGLSGLDCSVVSVPEKKCVLGLDFCAGCRQCGFINTHLYGCYEAQRWGGQYIYYCPAGFIFIAAAAENELGLLERGVLSGPIVMGVPADFGDTQGVPVRSTTQVHDTAQILGAVFAKVDRAVEEEDAFLKDLYNVMDEIKVQGPTTYPVNLERDLQAAIVHGEQERAKELLNHLLGYIFFSSNAQLDTIKSRVLELLVLLSRSAIEGGADVGQVFALNSDYLKQVEGFASVERLSVWLTGVINRYISYVFEFNEAKHTDVMYKVTAYIKEHFSQRITLSDVARHVYLSSSYLSKIFKDEMHTSLTAYVNAVRIDKSKALLLDGRLSIAQVAQIIGFDSQSYFTKVFKKAVGISPGKYREKKGIYKEAIT